MAGLEGKLAVLLLLPLLCTARQLHQSGSSNEALVGEYLSKVLFNESALMDFVRAMPKGGDVHNHVSGTAYAEDLIELALKANGWYCPTTRAVDAPNNTNICEAGWQPLKDAIKANPKVRDLLTEDWSMYNYQAGPSKTQASHFFDTFLKFGWAADVDKPELMRRIIKRAKLENVKYMEMMAEGAKGPAIDKATETDWDSLIAALRDGRNSTAMQALLGKIHSNLTARSDWSSSVQKLAAKQTALQAGLEDANMTVRLQTYTQRTNPSNAQIFLRMATAAAAYSKTPVLVGINLVAAENDPYSLLNYWVHMQIFSFLNRVYPDVPISLHAGELTMGMVVPEDLVWHIAEAINVGGARRIGHGVDLPYELDAEQTLKTMREKKIAIEVPFTSNEVILGVEGTKHSFMMYRAAEVPYLIASDDYGILRNTLTDQYKLLFQRYEVPYSEAKAAVFNSIEYSFIKEADVKARLKSELTADFAAFEAAMLEKAQFYDE